MRRDEKRCEIMVVASRMKASFGSSLEEKQLRLDALVE